MLIILGILLFIAFLSFFFTGKIDQSTLSELASRDTNAENWLNKLGAWVSDLFITRGFGIASFIFSGLLFLSGVYVTLDIKKTRLLKHWIWGTLIVIWLSIFFGFFSHKYDTLGGTIGFEMNTFFQDYIGKIGTALLLVFGLITYLAIRFKVTGESFVKLFKSAKKDFTEEFETTTGNAETDASVPLDNDLSAEAEEIKSAFEIPLENLEPTIKNHSKPEPKAKDLDMEVIKKEEPKKAIKDDVTIEVEDIAEEVSETDNLSNKLVEDFGTV